MILAPIGPITAYRMHTPRWAGTPTSGAGAGAHGGRANRPGTDALYLALDIETAVREYQQASALMPPGTLVSYTVALTKAVDFSNGYQPLTWEPLWEDFHCDWRELWFNQRVEPPSWVLADQALGQGAKGICFRSRLTGEQMWSSTRANSPSVRERAPPATITCTRTTPVARCQKTRTPGGNRPDTIRRVARSITVRPRTRII